MNPSASNHLFGLRIGETRRLSQGGDESLSCFASYESVFRAWNTDIQIPAPTSPAWVVVDSIPLLYQLIVEGIKPLMAKTDRVVEIGEGLSLFAHVDEVGAVETLLRFCDGDVVEVSRLGLNDFVVEWELLKAELWSSIRACSGDIAPLLRRYPPGPV